MVDDELVVLDRAHRLFTASGLAVPVTASQAHYAGLLAQPAGLNTGGGQERYRATLRAHQATLQSTGQTDATVNGVVSAARRDHARARELTKQVVEEARADAIRTPDSPLAQREAMRRTAARLRTQQAHLQSARHEALRHRSALQGLRYRRGHRGRRAAARVPLSRGRAGLAVRAALSRLGRPYVWGATGPNQFDCSGLTQWAYGQAGLHLDRTTYQQIHAGIPVARADIRPGDLVFPSTGHVQLAIGNNLVVEAPHAGAAVRISPLGSHLAIRRPAP